jgi:methylated-DNA-[protein]-cysteine S-methyltransferase
MTRCYTYVDTPLGRMLLQGDGYFVTGLLMPSHKRWPGLDASWQRTDAPFALVRSQLAEYFAGTRQQFDVPLQLDGTPFQQQVWQELRRIPYGETISYAELAARIGKPAGARAVGHANGRNRVAIIVPCHRVIGANSKLTGYAGGMDNKRWLLAWEQRATTEPLFRSAKFHGAVPMGSTVRHCADECRRMAGATV